MSIRLIVALQIAGFAAAAALLVYFGRSSAQWPWFLAAFAVHTVGDALFLAKEGFPVPFKLSNIEQFVKLPAFLVFVGIALAAVFLYFVKTSGFGHFAKGVAIVGLFVALAGFVYDKIYP